MLTEEDLKKYWMPDNACKECFHCGLKFTISRRKHHCRVCGQIFCSSCCYQMIDGRMLRVEGLLRVCNTCLQTVFTAEHSPRHHASTTVSNLPNQLDRSTDDFTNTSIRSDLPQSDSPVNRRVSMRSFTSWEAGVNPQLSVVESSPQHSSTGFFLYGAEEEQLLAIEKVSMYTCIVVVVLRGLYIVTIYSLDQGQLRRWGWWGHHISQILIVAIVIMLIYQYTLIEQSHPVM